MENAISIQIGILAFVGMQFVQFGIKHATASVSNKETRRDLEVKRIESSIMEVRSLACESWALAGADPKQDQLRNAVVGRIAFVSLAIKELFRNDKKKYALVSEKYFDFFIACTGSNFIVSDRSADAKRGQEIVLSAYDLTHNVATQRIYLSKWKLWQRA